VGRKNGSSERIGREVIGVEVDMEVDMAGLFGGVVWSVRALIARGHHISEALSAGSEASTAIHVFHSGNSMLVGSLNCSKNIHIGL